MFNDLQSLPGDPILSVMQAFRKDTHPQRIDLSAGVYKTDEGHTPVLRAVRAGEAMVIREQTSKVYVGIPGNPVFNEAQQRMIFGDTHPARTDARATTVQTPGGSGGLRVAAEFINSVRPNAVVYVSDPTWGNHMPLLRSAGLTLETYPYYNRVTHAIDFDTMHSVLSTLEAGTIVLLHGCCHNPTGADLTLAQWQSVTTVCQQRGLIPFIDMAYQGFADGLDEDVAGIRHMAQHLPEMFVVSSCSKNFGLYRERTGSLSVLAANTSAREATLSHLQRIIRRIYSMPPDHGAAIVAAISQDPALYQDWVNEVGEMRERMRELRSMLNTHLRQHNAQADFDFVSAQRGMFSLLGLSPEQVARLRDEFHIYIVGSSRINVAGITTKNVDYLASSIAQVVR